MKNFIQIYILTSCLWFLSGSASFFFFFPSFLAYFQNSVITVLWEKGTLLVADDITESVWVEHVQLSKCNLSNKFHPKSFIS